MICKYFLPFSASPFHFLDNALQSTKVFNFDVKFIYFFFSSSLCIWYLRNHCIILHFLPRVLHFGLLHLGVDPFWVNFYIWYKAGVQLHSFACTYSVVPAPFVKKPILPPLNCLGTLIKNQLAINVWVYFWTVNSIPLTCVFLCQYHTVLTTIAL